jgi:RNA polymerase sigma-70 factor, ECF subfamily
VTQRTDGELVAAVLAGDRAAFGPLVARHQEQLFRRALALVGDADLAADMVQEAFIRAYSGLASADPHRFAGWIYRILRNLCLDELRAPRHKGAALPVDLRAGGDPARDLERRELGNSLDHALAGLTPTLREAFVLKHVEGLSYEEMAAQTGAAEGALKMRVKRAREALQQLLQPMDGDGAM